MIIDLILISVGLLGLLFASISDIKTREVPDWLSYSLIIIGLALRLFHSLLYKEWSYFLYALIAVASLWILGNIMYLTKQWGGGDAKLLIALGALFATKPFFLGSLELPFTVILIANILIAGAIYGLIIGLILILKNRKSFAKELIYYKKDPAIGKIKKHVLLLALPVIIVILILKNYNLRLALSAFTLFVLLYPYLKTVVKAMEKSALYKYIPAKKLTPGDWVEQEIIVNKKIIYKPKLYGIEENDIRRLIKLRAKKVLVKEGIPFVPPFFIGTLLTLLLGKILFLI